MSGRTVPRFTLAGLLAAALASPVVAQVSNPCCGHVAPMPRQAGTYSVALPPLIDVEFGIEIGSGPIVIARGINFNAQPAASVAPGCCTATVAPQHTRTVIVNEQNLGAQHRVTDPGCAAAAQACPAHTIAVRLDSQPSCCAEACCAKIGKLAGTWVRDLDGAVISATFSGDEMKLCLSQHVEGSSICVTITADYALTKEGLVHGVITGVDVGCKTDPKQVKKGDAKQSMAMELAELSATLQVLTDCPFSFRMKQTSAGIMVSNLKFAVGGNELASKEIGMLCGMYKSPAAGKVPAPAAPLIFETWTGGLTQPSGKCLEHHPQPHELAAPCAVPAMPQPVMPAGCIHAVPALKMTPPMPPGISMTGCGTVCLPAPACPQAGWCPAQPVNVPAGEFGMMADVFGQMLVGQATCKPGPAPLPAGEYSNQPPCPVPAGCPLPPGVAVGGPVPAMPCAVIPTIGYVQAAPVMPPAAKPGIVGTWYREIGTKQCVIKFAGDHLTITITESCEIEPGKIATCCMVLTADYQMTRDGTTAVGVFTCVDLKFEGDMPEELAREAIGALAECQKTFEEKPFALRVRLYGDSLVIGNVRMPEVSDAQFDVQPATLIGGRYKNAGDQPLPKLKPSKPVLINRYSDTPSTLNLPLGEPFGNAVSPVGGTQPPHVQGLPATVPTMPQPTPPGPVAEPKPGQMLKLQFSTDPNIRMQQLLYQSEDSGLIRRERRGFWFNNQPSHLTPERIHGGIY